MIAKRFNEELYYAIITELGLHPVVAQHVAGCDITLEGLKEIISASSRDTLPSPSSLHNIDFTVERIHQYMAAKKRILVYGDYDTDGMTSTSILYFMLKAIGADVQYMVPHPGIHGRGVSVSIANSIVAELAPDLVITVDTGILDVEGVDVLNDAGVEVVITDHHLPEKDLPNCTIINPKVSGEKEFANIAGCGVALFLAYALYLADGRVSPSALKHVMQLAAIGTITDAVPIDHTNKCIVLKGLEMMAQEPAPFVTALYAEQTEQGKPMDTEAISFHMAPKITAAGKYGRCDLVMDLFSTMDSSKASECVHYMEIIREKRKKMTEAIYAEAEEYLSSLGELNFKCIVIANPDWDRSVLGVVASRLVEKYNLPAVVCGYGDTGYSGSARSPSAIDIHACLESIPPHIRQDFGGHKNSCGITFRRQDIGAVERHIHAYANEHFAAYISDIEVSVIVRPEDINMQMVNDFKLVSPFSSVIGKPTLGLINCTVEVDRILKDTHTKLNLITKDGNVIPCLLFKRVYGAVGSRFEGVDMTGAVSLNHYNGNVTLQFMVSYISDPIERSTNA